jgi:hypothetical protein
MMTSQSNIDSNTSIKDYLLPKLTKAAQANFEQCIAMHYYITGTSFIHVEEEHLAMAMKILRPDAQLPKRKKMGDSLLKTSFKGLKVKVDVHLTNTTVCLTTDRWTNIHNNPNITYMVTSPTTSLFLESVSTGEQGHTANWIASGIQLVMDGYPTTIFAGAVTDNTSTNKNTWEQLSQLYPSAFFQGCTSHGLLHLLVKDIFAAT